LSRQSYIRVGDRPERVVERHARERRHRRRGGPAREPQDAHDPDDDDDRDERVSPGPSLELEVPHLISARIGLAGGWIRSGRRR
jgi:hypothetical protein